MRLLLFLFSVSAAFGQPLGDAKSLQGRPVAPTAPTDTQVICWDATAVAWKPCAAGGSGDMIASTYVQSGANAPTNPCTPAGAVYIRTGVTPRTRQDCLTTGGNWSEPVVVGPITFPAATFASAPTNAVVGSTYWFTDASAAGTCVGTGTAKSACRCNAATGGTCSGWDAVGGGGGSGNVIRPCEIVIGDPGAASPVLADDNDAPAVCGNVFGATLTITAVKCRAEAGSPTVTSIITGGSGTSILTGALTCGTGSFAAGTLNGTPTQSTDGTIDANITSAGGTAKYIVLRIERTL